MIRFLLSFVFIFLFSVTALSKHWFPLTNQFNSFVNNHDRGISYSEVLTRGHLEVTVSVPGVLVDKVEGGAELFSSLEIPSEGYSTYVGRPKIPVIRRFVKVPRNSTLKVMGVETQSIIYNLEELDALSTIYPVQRSHSKGDVDKPSFSIDKKFYSLDQYTSDRVVKVGKQISVKGETYNLVEIFPISYNPSKNILNVTADLKITFLVSGEDVVKSRPEFQQKGMLVIVGDQFKDIPKFKKYIQLKRELGFKTKVLPVSEVGETDLEIRSFLLEEYKQWTGPYLDYILIVGDVDQVPTHKGRAMGKTQVTDNFYATLDKEAYSEDLTSPDVGIGRLSVENEDELDIVLDKLIQYGNASFSNFDWVKKIALVATTDRAWFHVAEGTFNFIIANYLENLGYTGIFPIVPNPGADTLYAITHSAKTDDVLASMNDGRVVLNYSGHGSRTAWQGPTFDKNDMEKLTHSSIPYVISNACLTASFSAAVPSFAEKWLRSPKGAIAFWGASNNSYWDEDDIMGKSSWESFMMNGKTRIAEMNKVGLEKVREHYNNQGKVPYYYEIYNLMGDPSTRLFTEVPTGLNVKFDTVIIGAKKIVLEITDKDGPYKGANVRLLSPKNSEVDSFAVSDENGLVEIEIDTATLDPGTLHAHVSGQNRFKKRVSIPLVVPQGPYFLIKSAKVDNEFISPMDIFDVSFEIKNVGVEAGKPEIEFSALALGLKYLIKIQGGCDDNYVDAGATVTCRGKYRLKLEELYEDRTKLHSKVTIRSGNHSNEASFFLEVANASFVLKSTKFEELSGNANGSLDPGENARVSFVLKNIGRLKSVHHMVVLSSQNSCFELVDGPQKVLPTVDIYQEAQVAFDTKIRENCPNGSIGKLVLKVISDTSFEFLEETILQRVGTLLELTFNGTQNIKIPDNNVDGVTLPVSVDQNVIVSRIKVFVDIKHFFSGDLILTLEAPDGKKVVLRSRSGGGADHIVGWFGAELVTKESLELFNSINAFGEWKLNVSDRANSDAGVLNDWKLFVAGYVQQDIN